jgi:hypothetical protein
MVRFHDALDPSLHLAGTKESEHIFDNSYKVNIILDSSKISNFTIAGSKELNQFGF